MNIVKAFERSFLEKFLTFLNKWEIQRLTEYRFFFFYTIQREMILKS